MNAIAKQSIKSRLNSDFVYYLETTDGCYCGAGLVGKMDSNLVSVVPYTSSEQQCSDLCKAEASCQFYTYFSQEDENNQMLCFLQSDLQPPYEPCDGCHTGPGDCSDFSLCEISYSGVDTDHLLLEDTSMVHNVTVLALGLSDCQFKMMAIAGGGAGYTYMGYTNVNGGGGSGNIDFYEQNVSPGVVHMSIIVGGEHNDTIVKDANGTEILKVDPGSLGQAGYGGSGYSGGGYGPEVETSFEGGSNGTDGQGSNGGSGSEITISDYGNDQFRNSCNMQ